MNLSTHLQLVPRSRKRGPIHPLPYTSSCLLSYLVNSNLGLLRLVAVGDAAEVSVISAYIL
jgi:hypothetical protein